METKDTLNRKRWSVNQRRLARESMAREFAERDEDRIRAESETFNVSGKWSNVEDVA